MTAGTLKEESNVLLTSVGHNHALHITSSMLHHLPVIPAIFVILVTLERGLSDRRYRTISANVSLTPDFRRHNIPSNISRSANS